VSAVEAVLTCCDRNKGARVNVKIMQIYIAQLRRAHNALVSLVLREEMSIQSRLEGVRTQRRVTEVSW